MPIKIKMLSGKSVVIVSKDALEKSILRRIVSDIGGVCIHSTGSPDNLIKYLGESLDLIDVIIINNEMLEPNMSYVISKVRLMTSARIVLCTESRAFIEMADGSVSPFSSCSSSEIIRVKSELGSVMEFGGSKNKGYSYSVVPFKGLFFKPKVIAIGCSTGGPRVLEAILKPIPKDYPIPIVVVQHMNSSFIESLALRLDSNIGLNVVVAKHGMILNPGSVAIAPAGLDLKVGVGLRISLSKGSDFGWSPSVDCLFSSVAESFAGNSVGIVLTGIGNDGMIGSEILKGKGGLVMVQDKKSSSAWGMPSSVLKIGSAHEVHGISSMVSRLKDFKKLVS